MVEAPSYQSHGSEREHSSCGHPLINCGAVNAVIDCETFTLAGSERRDTAGSEREQLQRPVIAGDIRGHRFSYTAQCRYNKEMAVFLIFPLSREISF